MKSGSINQNLGTPKDKYILRIERGVKILHSLTGETEDYNRYKQIAQNGNSISYASLALQARHLESLCIMYMEQKSKETLEVFVPTGEYRELRAELPQS